MSDSEFPYSNVIRVYCASPEHADIVAQTMSVDKELQQDKVVRVVTTDGNYVVGKILSNDPRALRTATSAFFDMITVSVRTLREFS